MKKLFPETVAYYGKRYAHNPDGLAHLADAILERARKGHALGRATYIFPNGQRVVRRLKKQMKGLLPW